MTIKFRIEYHTQPGEELVLVLGRGCGRECRMRYAGGGMWEYTLCVESSDEVSEYRYRVCRDGQTVRREWGGGHRLELDAKSRLAEAAVAVYDCWHDMPSDRPMRSSMFTDGVFSRGDRRCRPALRAGELLVTAEIPGVRPWQHPVLVGQGKALGDWNPRQGIEMEWCGGVEWCARVKLAKTGGMVRYKFVLTDERSDAALWEIGCDREASFGAAQAACVVVSSLRPRFDLPAWRGAGVAIPVFSLRSEHSFGVGEFADLKLMVDWAAATGQSMIQILPVNDTTMTGTWQDSYPYNANTTFALHPQFIRLSQVGELKDAGMAARFEALQRELNALPTVDYERVNRAKSEYLHAVYRDRARATFRSREFKSFMQANEDWLRPYAVFCALRDEHSTPDFTKWGSMARYSAAKAAKYEKEHYDEVAYNYFVQYHLSRQLREVRDYAHSRGVVLKGDIPIGVSRTSVDAWVYPSLFNMDSSAGAPPDDFSVMGQLWGFPTYNWQKMSEDGYAWWRARFEKMAEYFDAYRIDHILGFFRIWEIPLDAVNALLGRFNPALPYTEQEIAGYGFRFDRSRHTADISVTDNVLFVEDSRRSGVYHPRISAQSTSLYRELPEEQKRAYDNLYNDFFYRRHDAFWQHEAMMKLPPLIDSTQMLVCGEDLGMIPHCVPQVMADEQILSLEIQRMPKDPREEFASPWNYPYLSVCTTSTHDMAPLRAWWEEEREVCRRFYNNVLGEWGDAPYYCEPWICERIISMHLKSPAMLTVLPWQDWMSINGVLRRENPAEERINVPANPRHYWRYRMHITLEELLAADSLNRTIRHLIAESGR